MVAHSRQHKRKKNNTKQRKLVLIGSEGNNRTERNYFSSLARDSKNYSVRFAAGNCTDPVGIVKQMIKSIKSEELDFDAGDIAFCVIDTDTDIKKLPLINEAKKLASDNGIELILSIPCFELWFLMHFDWYSTHHFSDSKEVIDKLKSFIPNYSKGGDAFAVLPKETQSAIEKSKRLYEYHKATGHEGHLFDCNPCTDVYRIVQMIL